MNHRNIPSQAKLDSLTFGYVYMTTGPGGRIYVGRHKHIQGESWDYYMGSGYLLADEARFVHPEAFLNPQNVSIKGLRRKPDSTLPGYHKDLLCATNSASDAADKEAHWIRRLLISGKPTYNLELPDDFAPSLQNTYNDLAFRLSFQPNEIASLSAHLDTVEDAIPSLRGTPAFALQRRALVEARRIRECRSTYARYPTPGMRF